MRPDVESDLRDRVLGCISRFSFTWTVLAKNSQITVLNVAAIFAQMQRDAVRPAQLRQRCRPDRVRLDRPPGLPDRRHMIEYSLPVRPCPSPISLLAVHVNASRRVADVSNADSDRSVRPWTLPSINRSCRSPSDVTSYATQRFRQESGATIVAAEQVFIGLTTSGLCAVGLAREAWFLSETKKMAAFGPPVRHAKRHVGVERSVVVGVLFGLALANRVVNPIRWSSTSANVKPGLQIAHC